MSILSGEAFVAHQMQRHMTLAATRLKEALDKGAFDDSFVGRQYSISLASEPLCAIASFAKIIGDYPFAVWFSDVFQEIACCQLQNTRVAQDCFCFSLDYGENWHQAHEDWSQRRLRWDQERKK